MKEELPPDLRPERVLETLVDDITEAPVNKVPGIMTQMGPKFGEQVNKLSVKR